MCLEFLKARVDLHYICIIFSYDPIFIMLSTIPYTALFSPTPIFSSSSIAFFMFWPWPPIYVDAHTVLYTLHSIPYTALLGPIPIFSSSSIAFLIFWPSSLIYVKDWPYLTLHSLHSSPPQPSPCRLLCLTLLQSFRVILVLSLLFFCFDRCAEIPT